MITRQENEIRQRLIEAIDKFFDDPKLEDFGCWYGPNQIERMADAALSVLMATKEAQKTMKEDNLEPQ